MELVQYGYVITSYSIHYTKLYEISPNVGALTKMLGRLMSGPTVTGIRERSKKLMHRDSRTWRFMSRWEEHIKGMVMPSTLFEELGFNYLGP